MEREEEYYETARETEMPSSRGRSSGGLRLKMSLGAQIAHAFKRKQIHILHFPLGLLGVGSRFQRPQCTSDIRRVSCSFSMRSNSHKRE